MQSCVHRPHRVGIGAITIAIAGCVSTNPAPEVSSNKVPGSIVEPKRVFVLTDVAVDMGAKFHDSFERKLRDVVDSCGATMEVDKMTNLELDDQAYQRKMREFGADTFLRVRRNGGTRSSTGDIIQARFDARMFDTRTKQTIWRGSVDFPRRERGLHNEGEVLAAAIASKLKEDRVFQSCRQ